MFKEVVLQAYYLDGKYITWGTELYDGFLRMVGRGVQDECDAGNGGFNLLSVSLEGNRVAVSFTRKDDPEYIEEVFVHVIGDELSCWRGELEEGFVPTSAVLLSNDLLLVCGTEECRLERIKSRRAFLELETVRSFPTGYPIEAMNYVGDCVVAADHRGRVMTYRVSDLRRGSFRSVDEADAGAWSPILAYGRKRYALFAFDESEWFSARPKYVSVLFEVRNCRLERVRRFSGIAAISPDERGIAVAEPVSGKMTRVQLIAADGSVQMWKEVAGEAVHVSWEDQPVLTVVQGGTSVVMPI